MAMMSTATSAAQLPADWEGYWTNYTLLKGRSLRPRTLAAYRDSFIYLGRFLAPDVPDLADLNRRQVAAYVDHTMATTSASTTGLRYRGLAAVINFLADPGEDDEPFIPKNPMKGLRPPKVEEQPVAVLSIDDAKALLKACKGPAFEARRDEALIRFMFDTGCRRGEVASMKVGYGLDLHEGRALVTGKTGTRWVAFGPATGAALYRYIRVRRATVHTGFTTTAGPMAPTS
jgi:site-specific recombinase XerD